MKYQGKVSLQATAETVWDVVLDIEQFADCMPGMQDLEKIDDRTFEGGMSAKVGPVSGDIRFRSQIVDVDPHVSLTAHVEGEDSLTKSTMSSDITMTLAPDGTSTELTYVAEVNIKGRLGIVGDMILRATGVQVIDEFFNRLRKKVEVPA
ncbi:MAG: carbon monoxide dehydrogenase subunit G [Chloroflexi bacterium]|nr:carbon monoxide dehydrogenase subunit G [Chloroflexota bacterium]